MSKLFKGAAAAALTLGLAAFALPAQADPLPVPPSNNLTVLKSCTASDVTFESRAEWKYTYVAGGATKAWIDRLEWSIQQQDDPATKTDESTVQGTDPQYGADDTTDYTLKVYDGDARVQTLAGDDVEVNYANDLEDGTLWKGRNPKNPVIKAGSRITLVVGVDGDGKPGCKVTFRVPAELGPKLAE